MCFPSQLQFKKDLSKENRHSKKNCSGEKGQKQQNEQEVGRKACDLSPPALMSSIHNLLSKPPQYIFFKFKPTS